MLVDKSSEPLAQSTSLISNLVQFTRLCAHLQLIQCVRRHKFGLSQPSQEAITAVEPVNSRIDRRRDGVQEIETERVGDKNCRRSVFHDWPTGEGSNRITGQAVLDKLFAVTITCQVSFERLCQAAVQEQPNGNERCQRGACPPRVGCDQRLRAAALIALRDRRNGDAAD
jgi:hypothetical protein